MTPLFHMLKSLKVMRTKPFVYVNFIISIYVDFIISICILLRDVLCISRRGSARKP